MYITVQLCEGLAQDLTRRQPRLADTRRLREVLSELQVTLQPLHPGVDDPELGRQFYVSVPHEQQAEEIAERLRQSGVVEAAYVKPPDAAPSL